MLPDTSELDSKLAINTDAMESVDNLGFEQQTQDPCSSSDRIMCKVIDDMLSSNGLFWSIALYSPMCKFYQGIFWNNCT